ncbi:DUF1838 family protein [Novosphingobium sp. Leaf2]|uniref:DUF1838 family protein n=1 Tax=Novosphingobium sp. Leaf2 TaxID=1735670 RepID=UPI0006F29977|nr:DUF1838 family protein [Novosphingobium sp. Leaf2]KQM13322.1 hypothetical protein ASE49_12890 [Novosphingobium sp. Leaf2]
MGMTFGRRGALGVAAAGLFAGHAGAALASAKMAGPSLDTPAGRLRAYMMMHGALDERLVIGYLSGSYFGVVNAEMTPLWDVVGVTFSRYRRRSDGGYDGVTGEIAFFFDPATGKAPGRFFNPYTGAWVTDPQSNLPPSRITFSPTGEMQVPHLPPGATFDHVIKAPQVRGDDIWISAVTRAGIPAPAGKPAFHYNEMVTLHGRVSDLSRGDLGRIPCEVTFTNVVDWRPWMGMAGRPGHLTAIGSGRLGVSISDLPKPWIEATRQKFPAILDDPGSLIEQLWES